MGPQPLSVHYEWGRLKEAIVGMAEDLLIPGHHRAACFRPDPQYLEMCQKHGGKPAALVEPELTAKIKSEIDRLARVLKNMGVRVHRPRRLGSTQMGYLGYVQAGAVFLFPRDPILVIGSNVIETALKAPMRAKERFALRPLIMGRMQGAGGNYISMPPASPLYNEKGVYLEGGDVLLNGREVYVGLSERASNRAGLRWLERVLGPGYRVHGLRLTGEFLHLDCVLALLRPGLGVIYPQGLQSPLPPSLAGWEFVELSQLEVRGLAANLLVLAEGKVILDQRHQGLAGRLRAKGVKVVELPFGAVAAWGGGLRCAHHPLVRT